MSPENDVRKPAVSGQFYPGNPTALAQTIDRDLAGSRLAGIPGNILALVVPHAGYVYSGQTAAAGYRQVQGMTFDAVVVIAPSHQELFSGASVYAKGAYETPLGLAPVDRELAEAIVDQYPSIHSSIAGHREEHALEVQVPFLQRTVENLKIVPIVMGERSPGLCSAVAQAIASAGQGKRLLIVASSDLYHGHSYEACVASDRRTLAAIQALDPEAFLGGLDSEYQACGGGPIAAALMAARQLGADAVKVLAQTNSNDVMGTRGGYVVGYGAAVAFKSR